MKAVSKSLHSQRREMVAHSRKVGWKRWFVFIVRSSSAGNLLQRACVPGISFQNFVLRRVKQCSPNTYSVCSSLRSKLCCRLTLSFSRRHSHYLLSTSTLNLLDNLSRILFKLSEMHVVAGDAPGRFSTAYCEC